RKARSPTAKSLIARQLTGKNPIGRRLAVGLRVMIFSTMRFFVAGLLAVRFLPTRYFVVGFLIDSSLWDPTPSV
ncbi:hypothetical protein J6590_054909, partial [Homalodisca vitripennis]